MADNDIFGLSDLLDSDVSETSDESTAVTKKTKTETGLSEPVKTTNSPDLTESHGSSESELSMFGEHVPRLIGESFPDEFLQAYRKTAHCYNELPILDEDDIYAELANLTIKSNPTKTIEVVNQELQRVQGAKERLSEIMVDILRAYHVKKRLVDILTNAWMKNSGESSSDKRKGDASLKLAEFEIDFARTESLMRAANYIANNLDSLQDNLSRRITIFQLQLKLNDIGRGGLPSYDFNDIPDNQEIESNYDQDENPDAPAPETLNW